MLLFLHALFHSFIIFKHFLWFLTYFYTLHLYMIILLTFLLTWKWLKIGRNIIFYPRFLLWGKWLDWIVMLRASCQTPGKKVCLLVVGRVYILWLQRRLDTSWGIDSVVFVIAFWGLVIWEIKKKRSQFGRKRSQKEQLRSCFYYTGL